MNYIYILLILPLVVGLPTPQTSENTLVVTTDAATTINKDDVTTDKEQKDFTPPKITNLDVHSNISNRFAKTLVKSKVKNEAPVAQETTFFIIIPEQAFISGFIMEISGKNYTAYVQEKEQAKQTYDNAVLSGIGAAHIALSARDSNKFTVSTNIEPESKVIFYLTYEELLERKDGVYELVINIHPNQLVKHMQVDVDIEESRPLTTVKAPPIRSGNEIIKENPKLDPKADIQRPAPEKAHITFIPDYEQQKQIAQGLGKEEKDGIGGQFVVQYDVERDPHGGQVLVKDGYFVHYFAPSEIAPLDKHVVFVLDTSGSMYDRKMLQLKSAMQNILGELRPKDFFNLVEFNTNVKVWNLDAPGESTYFPNSEDNWYNGDTFFDLEEFSFPPAYPVTNSTIKKAKKAVDQMEATGGTNIYEALRVGLHLIKTRKMRTGDKNTQPLIVFLTDGDPTVGKTITTGIITQIQEQNLAKVPIISLSFGTGADRNFLQKLSLKNIGFARHIYEDSDASLQLENFYKEISSPLLHDIKFVYTPDITSLTRSEFPILYGGAEIIVTGKYSGNDFNKETSKVVSWGRNGPIDLLPSIQRATGQLERLWAYLTIKRYLDAKDVAAGNTSEYESKALELSKKYSFVTPLTSLVVVRPDGSSSNKSVNVEAADQDGDRSYGVSAFSVSTAPQVQNRIFYSLARPQNSFSPAYAKIGGGGGAAGLGGFAFGRPLAGPPAPGGFAPTFHAAVLPQEESALDSDSGAYPLIVGGNAASTTMFLPEVTTEATTTSTTTVEPVTLPPDFISKLPWLNEHIRPDGTLKFLRGNYQFGFNETSPVDENCTDPKSEEGLCVLVKDCEDIYSELTSPKTFKDYFCAIDDKFVGVCCAKKKVKVSEP